MKDLRLRPGAKRIRAYVAEGEHENQGFKFAISDPRKIARSVSAFANRSGGRLLIGVKDNGVIAGVRNDEDIYVVQTAAERYCMPPQQISFDGFSIDADVHVIVATVPRSAQLPVYVREQNGLKAYWRCHDENIAAPTLLVNAWEIAASPLATRLDSTHTCVLSLMKPDGIEADVVAMALQLHLPVATVSRAVSELIALGSIEIKHDHGRFTLHTL